MHDPFFLSSYNTAYSEKLKSAQKTIQELQSVLESLEPPGNTLRRCISKAYKAYELLESLRYQELNKAGLDASRQTITNCMQLIGFIRGRFPRVIHPCNALLQDMQSMLSAVKSLRN